ncbi:MULTISPECIES: TonB-dependent receptor [Sphingomonas]|jgi:iron complex outermembrane recepter protein|uniref:TonB-dependent receptor n=1 Tax=Sphingomonas TaxID=13687 RepID=UPI001584DEB7|nr:MULTISPECIES: TonB-dependent receptor [Sphingomonas]MBB4048762.1 iron complex outermembrane receptor protein [Sphingomonas zeae]MDK8186091.1 TonB-dependent receptor [Sphingomonas zeae]MDK8215399.1 TonB-dependent receptor [Sphingomonas sp. UMB7805-LC452B]
MNTNFVRAALLGGSALLALSATPAFAADTKPAADPAPAAPAAADPATDSGELKDIVVTATKRETSLQKTPIAISVIDPTVLKDRHVQSLLDLADGTVPSLRVATFEARQSALTVGIRGIVPFDQNQTARDTGVGVYFDGVYLGRSQGLNAALFDIERVEVLRGPQGTLFGRNTEGGALSIVTAKPTGKFGGSLTAGFGNYGAYNTSAHVNLPEFNNISVKLDGVIQHQDPFVKNPLPGSVGWGAYNRAGGHVAAVWKPVDGFSAELSYDQAKDENTPFYSQLINYNPRGLPVATIAQINANGGKLPAGTIAPLSPLVVVSGDDRMKTADIGVPQQYSVDRTHGFSAKLNYDVAPGLELRSITAWRGVSTDQWDNSGGAHRTVFLPNSKFSRYSLSFMQQHQFSQEFQAVGSLPQLDYVAGLFYFTENAREVAATPSTNQWNADGTGYTIVSQTALGAIGSGNQGWAPGSFFLQRGSFARAYSYAAFAQATYTPAGFDAFHLTLGGRYTHDKRNGTLYLVQGKSTNFPFTFDNNRFDPMVTAAFDATDTIHLYAKYSTGYRAGGANDRSQTFAAFGPEAVKSYEIGSKMDLFEHRVRLNLAGYIMDRTGTQIDFDNVDTNPASPTYNLHTEETRNAPGTSKIRGIEADITTNPVEGMTVGASYAYTYTNVPLTPNPFLGNALTQVFVVYTPRNAASAYADYEVPLAGSEAKVRFHLDANYADPSYSFQNETTRTDKTFVMNGRIALADLPLTEGGTKMTLSLWSRNLLNNTFIYRRSAANATTLGDYGNLNPPRTIGLEGTVRF